MAWAERMTEAMCSESTPGGGPARGAWSALLVAAAVLLLAPAGALGAPPQISNTSVSAVGQTQATLGASVNPLGANVKDAHFDYVTRAAYVAAGNDFGAGTLHTPITKLPGTVKATGQVTEKSSVVTGVALIEGSFGTGALAAGQSASGTGIPVGTTIVAVGEGTVTLSKPATETVSTILSATGPQPIRADLSGLEPGTAYVFRTSVETTKSTENTAVSPAAVFATASPAPIFGPCPNDAFRVGAFAPLGHPSSLLPDCRAYERATPLEKDGGDALAVPHFAKAADDGNAVTYGSDFGMPNGEGAQTLPFFVARRGAGEWVSQGLLPSANAGDKARFLTGWLPDLSLTLSVATKLTTPRTQALFAQEAGKPARQISGYGPDSDVESLYVFAGASADRQELALEALTETDEGGEPIPRSQGNSVPNVFVWDREADAMHLASVMNTPAETKALLPKGAFAGPYNWAKNRTTDGGARFLYYLQEEHAVSSDGSVYFTAALTGHLYERLNPTEAQSPLNGQGECTDPALACTIQVSASEREPADPQGAAPAAFQAASNDGNIAYFTSSEELTEDANTGPDQPPADIGRAKIGATEAEENEEGFLPAHASGTAVSPDHEYVYWADPVSHSIGRAKLNGEGKPTAVEPHFIEPGESECEVEVVGETGERELAKRPVPVHPNYVAVDDEYVYWSNSGLVEKGGNQPGTLFTTGSIGRAKLNGAGGATEVKPTFICGAANPQGIAVDSEHVYWANDGVNSQSHHVSRAGIDGTGTQINFVDVFGPYEPQGLVLSGDHIYFGLYDRPGNLGYVESAAVSSGVGDGTQFVGGTEVPGVAASGSDIFWVDAAHRRIGKIPQAAFSGSCTAPDCDPEYLETAGKPFGLATDEGHLYYSVNGESPPNPGNDLYRYTRAADGKGNHLTDLTPDQTDENGAEVQGVLGASEDGSTVYFVANADLDGPGPAEAGDCRWHNELSTTQGECNLYRWREGSIAFLARLDPGGSPHEVLGWAQTARELFGTGGLNPKTSLLSRDGQSLVLVSSLPLAGIATEGKGELYRFDGEGTDCLSCPPSGETPTAFGPSLGSSGFPEIGPRSLEGAMVAPRYLSGDGNRAFFESTEALLPADTNGDDGCKGLGSIPPCIDVYEWEAPGTGSCEENTPGYSPLNGGCLYLISTGTSRYPSVFLDASESGNDVFFLTRDQLVGSDEDHVQDVYDARVGGGLASQNPQPVISCEDEGCKPAATPPPSFAAPPSFSGPPNPAPKRCGKGKVLRNGRCVKKKGGGQKKHRGHHKKKGAGR